MSLLDSFVIACFFNSNINFILGIYVYIKNKKNLLNIIWGFFCLSVALWNLGLGLMVNSNTKELALFWLKHVLYLGLIFLPITFLHFCLILLKIDKKMKYLIFFTYITGIIFLILNHFGLLSTVKPSNPFKYYKYPTIFYYPFSILFVFYFIFAFYEIILKFKTADAHTKMKLKYFFIGSVIGFTGGSTAFLPEFNLPIFPFGIYIFSIYTLIVTYAIVRYHLMDIYIAIKKGALHTFMIAFVTIVYITTIFLFENILHYFFKYNTTLSRVIAGTIIALTFLPIHNKVKNIIDKLFFKERTESLQSINDFSQNLITILDLRLLMRAIVENIHLIIKVKHVSLFSSEGKEKIFKMKSFAGSKTLENEIKGKIIYQDSPIVCWLKSNKDIEIKNKIIKDDIKNLFTPVIVQMEELKAELVIPLFFDKKLTNILIIGEKNNQDIFSIEELNLLRSLANQASIAFTNAITYEKLKKLYFGTIEAFIKAIEAKDTYSQGHSYRVVDIATKIGIEYGLSREEIELIKYAGVLHDVGKISIPNNILTKSERLTKKEFDEIKKYPKIGSEIVSSIEYFEDAAKIILHHHERWDGKGYPNNLKSEQIPLISRIIFIADAYDAMTSSRSFRPALSKEAAIQELKNESGRQFDPAIVNCFISAYNKNLID